MADYEQYGEDEQFNGQYQEDEDCDPEEDGQWEPEPLRQGIVPLGKATSKALLDRDLNPFILDKMFHEGKMGRFAMAGAEMELKIGEGGSAQYEYHTWQLDHLFREVPKDMKAGLGIVTAKPKELLYEEEKFILGKMDRNLREAEGGYAPIAAQPESKMEINPNVRVPSKLPKEPAPCALPYIDEEDEEDCGRGRGNRGAPSKTASRQQQVQRGPPPAGRCPPIGKGKGGKVYQFTYTGGMDGE